MNIAEFVRYRAGGPMTLERRARWLHSACRRVLKAMEIECVIAGQLPARGLIVSNHLSYLDILIYGAALPCFFVSKAEVRRWPYFGWAARVGGAMFLERGRRSSSSEVTHTMAERLALDVPVLLFPEGTSTDGSSVLRFHSGLFEPAAAAAAPVTAAAIRYIPAVGQAERDLCWFGEASFLPHLFKVLGARRFSAVVRFAEPGFHSNRREAARATHEMVVAMRRGV